MKVQSDRRLPVTGGAIHQQSTDSQPTPNHSSFPQPQKKTQQESGVLSLSDLAVQYALSSQLLLSTIKERLGTAIRGRLEGSLLYTPSYVRNLKAQLRGALRGAAAPVSIPALVKDLGLDGLGGGGGGMLGGLVEELVAEGAVQGALKGGVQGGVWTPAVYSGAQAAAVKGFYEQNGWVTYETARRMGVANDKAYLASAFPDGVALETGECRLWVGWGFKSEDLLSSLL